MDSQASRHDGGPTVSDDSDANRYTVRVDGQVAGFTQYRRHGDLTTFVHTEIGEEYSGRGLGSILVKAALDDVRAHGGTIRPLCPFVRSYVERHPEYGDLVVAGHVR